MSVPPDVTVVIPTRNRRVLLAEALASLHSQVGVHWEAVVVDDHSTDDTWLWLQDLQDPRIRALQQMTCQRQAAARNLGLRQARGRYCLFLDDDDLLWPAALRSLAGALERTPRAVAAIGARQDWFTAQGYRRRDVHPQRPRLVDLTRPLLAGWSAVPSQTLFRTGLVRELGGFDPALVLCEDRDLLQRVARRGPVLLRPETVMTYRIRPQQWRPADIRQIREQVARRAIRSLPRQQWRRALRIRRLVSYLDAAEEACTHGSVLRAMPLLGRGLLEAPSTLLSPMIGPWVLRRLAGRVARRVIPEPQL